MDRSRMWSLGTCLLLALAGCGKVSNDGGDDGDNQPPVATAAELSTYMSTPVTGQLEGEDPDGDALEFSVAEDPAGGAVSITRDGSFRYTPARGTSGSDSFSFAIDDGNGGTDEATVDISIANLTDGTPDADFGDGGSALSDYGAADSHSSVIIADGGRIVASGTTGPGNYAVVAGYSTRGVPIAAWGEGGSGTTMIGIGDYDGFGDLVQQPDGRLVAVGQTLDGANYNLTLLGLTSDNGYLDNSFNGGSMVVMDEGSGQGDGASAVAVLADGRLLVAGYAFNGENNDFLVTRYSADGMRDDTFGNGGSARVDFGGYEQVDDIAIDGEGNILLVGEVSNDMGVARLTAEGDPDDGFGDGGKLTLDRGENDRATAVVVGADGAIYVGGSSQEGGVWSMAVAKLTDAGELDDSFGEGGWGLATASDADVYAYDMLILPNDTFLLVGSWVANAGGTEAAAARIDSSGRLDTGFGDGGFYHQSIGTGHDDQLVAVALQEDGKVVAAGSSQNATLDALLVRLGW